MSLILEALRKSEAERRRGQAPDLHAELPPAVQSARAGRPAWPWLLALAITAIVVALAMTWLARDPGARAPATVGVVTERSPDQDRASMPDGVTAARTDTRDAGTSPGAPAPIADIAPAADEPADISPRMADVAPAAEPPAALTASVEPTSAPSRLQPEPEPRAPPIRDRSDSRAAAVANAAPPVAAPTVSASPPAPASPPPPAAPPSRRAAAATAVENSAPLQLADLAAAERRGLPPLRISMHMWAPTPAGRFAIIDGARVNEGDRLGDAVVDEITRDGVVLAWQGRRVQVPIH